MGSVTPRPQLGEDLTHSATQSRRMLRLEEMYLRQTNATSDDASESPGRGQFWRCSEHGLDRSCECDHRHWR